MKTYRTLIRRLCFALVAARTLAFAVAPMVDLQILPTGGEQLAVMPGDEGGSTGLLLHDPARCAICALLHDTPWTPSTNDASHTAEPASDARFAAATDAVPSPPRHGFQSRAPPPSG